MSSSKPSNDVIRWVIHRCMTSMLTFFMLTCLQTHTNGFDKLLFGYFNDNVANTQKTAVNFRKHYSSKVSCVMPKITFCSRTLLNFVRRSSFFSASPHRLSCSVDCKRKKHYIIPASRFHVNILSVCMHLIVAGFLPCVDMPYMKYLNLQLHGPRTLFNIVYIIIYGKQ